MGAGASARPHGAPPKAALCCFQFLLDFWYDFKCFPMIFIDFQCFPMIFQWMVNRFPMFFYDFHRFPMFSVVHLDRPLMIFQFFASRRALPNFLCPFFIFPRSIKGSWVPETWVLNPMYEFKLIENMKKTRKKKRKFIKINLKT